MVLEKDGFNDDTICAQWPGQSLKYYVHWCRMKKSSEFPGIVACRDVAIFYSATQNYYASTDNNLNPCLFRDFFSREIVRSNMPTYLEAMQKKWQRHCARVLYSSRKILLTRWSSCIVHEYESACVTRDWWYPRGWNIGPTFDGPLLRSSWMPLPWAIYKGQPLYIYT